MLSNKNHIFEKLGNISVEEHYLDIQSIKIRSADDILVLDPLNGSCNVSYFHAMLDFF